jgi:hypothetical protein
MSVDDRPILHRSVRMKPVRMKAVRMKLDRMNEAHMRPKTQNAATRGTNGPLPVA